MQAPECKGGLGVRRGLGGVLLAFKGFSSCSEGLSPSKSESRTRSYLKVICCMLCASIYVYVNAERLMETGKGRKNRVGFAFPQDHCRAERGMPSST